MPLIDSISIHHYRLPLDPPFNAAWDPNPRRSFTATLVRVTAGEYEGVGSGDAMLGFSGHEHLFLGQDPFSIERHVRILDNLQFHYGRMWPLEVALWDLMGKISGQPVWQLLGGLRSTIRPYASTGERISPEARTAVVAELQAAGYQAVKLRFHAADPREDLAIVQAVREEVGPQMHLMVDANQGWQMPWDSRASWDLKTARWMADALAELDVYWLEEPLHRHNYQGLADLRRASKIRIAGGEGNREFADFEQYLAYGSLDVYQADVVWSTGLWRAAQLAQQVQRCGAIFSPHTWGDGLVLLANMHVVAGCSDTPFIEFPYDPPNWLPERRDFILPQPILPAADGLLHLGNAAGLGITIDWKGLEPLRIGHGKMEG